MPLTEDVMYLFTEFIVCFSARTKANYGLKIAILKMIKSNQNILLIPRLKNTETNIKIAVRKVEKCRKWRTAKRMPGERKKSSFTRGRWQQKEVSKSIWGESSGILVPLQQRRFSPG